MDSVRASTDKRQTPSPPPSFVCFKRHLFGGGFSSTVVLCRRRSSCLLPRTNPFPAARGARVGAHPVERMREIWGCMVRKATFECHRKGAERSFISPALSCHLRDPSTLHGHDGTLNFRSGPPAGSGKRWPGIFLSRRGEAGPCSLCLDSR